MAAKPSPGWRPWLLGLFVVLLSGSPVADAFAQAGINLSWDDCGAAGVPTKSFLCNTNTGPPFVMVASFVPPSGVGEFVGISAELSAKSCSSDLPNWWQHGTGLCRGSTALSMSTDFTSGPFTCADPWSGIGGGALNYSIVSANKARMQVLLAVPYPTTIPLDSGIEYYAFKVNLARSKTTGAGACNGCLNPVKVTLESLQLFQPAEVGFDPTLATSLNSNHVDWQPGCAAMVTVDIDARAVSSSTFTYDGGPCLDAAEVVTKEVIPGVAYTVGSCESNICGSPPSSMQFQVDASGNVSYPPAFEGRLGGAGTNTLFIYSYEDVAQDTEPSMGLFRIVIEPEFWPLMVGYPGFAVVNGVHRLISPTLTDPVTIIGRSPIHAHGSTADISGTPVGPAGTIVKDSDFAVVPPNFQGPDSPLEIHTEVRKLTLSGGGVTVNAGTGLGLPLCPGEIEAEPGEPGLFPASSFFNVFAEVTIPTFGTLHNTEPLLVENSPIDCFPPRVVYFHRHTGPVSVHFKSDDTIEPKRWYAGDRFGWLVLAGHGYDFDASVPPASVSGPTVLGDPFGEFEAIVNAEPEMEDTATVHVDITDVLTFASPSAFFAPGYRDSLQQGIDMAAALGKAGDPCAGVDIIHYLLVRVDSVAPPPDWVSDHAVRRVLKERIHSLGALLQTQANDEGGCLPPPLDVPPTVAPARVAIQAIQPNPTTGAATIHYAIPSPSRVTMAVYDLSGRLVRTLVDAEMSAGAHQAVWDGRQDRSGGRPATTGTYFVRLNVGGIEHVKRMVILR